MGRSSATRSWPGPAERQAALPVVCDQPDVRTSGRSRPFPAILLAPSSPPPIPYIVPVHMLDRSLHPESPSAARLGQGGRHYRPPWRSTCCWCLRQPRAAEVPVTCRRRQPGRSSRVFAASYRSALSRTDVRELPAARPAHFGMGALTCGGRGAVAPAGDPAAADLTGIGTAIEYLHPLPANCSQRDVVVQACGSLLGGARLWRAAVHEIRQRPGPLQPPPCQVLGPTWWASSCTCSCCSTRRSAGRDLPQAPRRATTRALR